jgi:hypothetical protein
MTELPSWTHWEKKRKKKEGKSSIPHVLNMGLLKLFSHLVLGPPGCQTVFITSFLK